MRKTDGIIVLVLLIIGLIIWMIYKQTLSKEPPVAEIFVNSSLVEKVRLDKGMDKTFTIKGKEQVVLHLKKNGSISFEASDCPDQICVGSGELGTAGKSAACLPNGMVIKIVSGNQGKEEPDMII